MNFLESKKIVHRDLSCRNCLVKEEEKSYIVKLTDFGLSDISSGTNELNNSELPVRWTAPEVLETKTFSSKTDCWSFGITLWELFSLGESKEKLFSSSSF